MRRNLYRTTNLCWAAVVALFLAGATSAAWAQVSDGPVIAPACPLVIDPVPSGPAGRPAEAFNVPGDYFWAHSGTHLQGTPADEKWAWGFYTPPGVFSGFRTAVIVDNPFPGTSVTVDIEYRDTAGNLLATSAGIVISPECYYTEQAAPLAGGGGFGSIRVVSTDGNLFVGATIHHSYTIGASVDPDFLSPGLASMQQLQRIQPNATTLFAGPFPVATGADPHAFNNGNLPTFQVVNPNPTANVLLVTLASPQLGGAFSNTVVVLPPFGSFMDLTLFNQLVPVYIPPAAGVNIDVVATVTSASGLPILGEQLMMDFFDSAMTPLGRFRMGSAMMESTPSLRVINPELTFTLSGPPVETLMSIANVGTGNAGPVRIEYRTQGGVALPPDVIPNLPPGGVQRIAPGEPGIVNYPIGVWDFTVRIVACDRIIGWTMRQVEPDPFGAQQFKKVYGETLDNTTGREPGRGFQVSTLGQILTRKVSPLERIASPSSFPPWWPGYNAIANFSVPNIGNYWYRSFGGIAPPFTCAETTNFAPQPFAGLPWSQASFTFKDGVAVPLALPPFVMEHLGTVDHQSGSINGIDVIGDPLREWGLGFPAGPGGEPPITDPDFPFLNHPEATSELLLRLTENDR